MDQLLGVVHAVKFVCYSVTKPNNNWLSPAVNFSDLKCQGAVLECTKKYLECDTNWEKLETSVFQ